MAQGHVGFLRTRVARRVFVLFVASALIPTGVFAVVSYRTVTRQLRDQSQARLMHASHAAELAVRERIDRLAEDLMIGGSVSGSTDPAGSTARDFTRRGFSDFSYVADHPSDDALPVRRRLDVLPPDVLQHLADGNAALIVSRDAAGAPLIVVATQLSGGCSTGSSIPRCSGGPPNSTPTCPRLDGSASSTTTDDPCIVQPRRSTCPHHPRY